MSEEVLTDLEKEILRIKLLEPGISHAEIARQVGKSRQWVRELINADPLRRIIDEHLAEALDAAREILQQGALKAARKLVNLVDNGDSDHTQRLAAMNILQILQRRGDSEDIGDEEWISEIGQSGAVKTEKVRRQIEAGEEDDEAN